MGGEGREEGGGEGDGEEMILCFKNEQFYLRMYRETIFRKWTPPPPTYEVFITPLLLKHLENM